MNPETNYAYLQIKIRMCHLLWAKDDRLCWEPQFIGRLTLLDFRLALNLSPIAPRQLGAPQRHVTLGPNSTYLHNLPTEHPLRNRKSGIGRINNKILNITRTNECGIPLSTKHHYVVSSLTHVPVTVKKWASKKLLVIIIELFTGDNVSARKNTHSSFTIHSPAHSQLLVRRSSSSYLSAETKPLS